MEGLYKAALFEVDKTRLPDRIAQAEEALVVRARELFQMAGDNIEEQHALDDTMYALHALQNTSQTSHCIPHRGEAPKSTATKPCVRAVLRRFRTCGQPIHDSAR